MMACFKPAFPHYLLHSTVSYQNDHVFLTLLVFLHHCWSSLTKGSQTDAIYTDYSSAFTSVSHRLLLHKLKMSFNFSGHALGWIESYLSQRSQRVILDGKQSDWVPVLSGVPEGSILGPILFTCYVADLPNHIKTSCLSYADDVKIFHRINSPADTLSLQADLDRLSLWSKTWHLKLNPAKCAFEVPSGKLLDFIVSRRGIELDPSKIKSIRDLPPPKNKKEVMSLLGRLNYISRFIAQLTTTCEPIFKLLKKDAAIKWTDDCQKPFDGIKDYLSNPPVLVPPEPGRPYFCIYW